MAFSSIVLPLGSALAKSLSTNHQTIARCKIKDVIVRHTSTELSGKDLHANKCWDELTLIKCRDVIGLVLGVSSLLLDSFDAKGAGLPPEEKPRLCDDACEKQLENVAANYVAMIPLGQIFDSSLKKGQPCIFRVGSDQIITNRRTEDVFIPTFASKRVCFSLKMRCNAKDFREMYYLFMRASHKNFHVVRAVSSGMEDIAVSSFSQFEDFSVSTSTTKADELKITVVVSGAKTQAIFDSVFSKMVVDAQPIPGFRRVKGGKTPDIPRDILLEVLGPSKVYKQVIKKVINCTVAEYLEKEGLTVSKDLRVGQSFEDLEATFEPGNQFSFEAVVQRQ